MIISKKYAMSLIRSGKATMDGYVVLSGRWGDSDQPVYGTITRLDVQRVDHFLERKP